MFVASVDDEGRLEHLKWPGMTFLVEQGFEEAGYSLPNMVINGETSGLESICGSFNGRLLLELEIVGERGHVATRPGVNAIKQAMKFIEALDGVELKQGPLQGRESLNVCAIEGLAERFDESRATHPLTQSSQPSMRSNARPKCPRPRELRA